MADAEHVKIFEQGRDAWDSWRRENPEIIPDLSGADLHGSDMKFANFKGAILRGAQLAGMYAPRVGGWARGGGGSSSEPARSLSEVRGGIESGERRWEGVEFGMVAKAKALKVDLIELFTGFVRVS